MSYFHAINGQGVSPEPTPSNDHPPVLLWTNPSPTSQFDAQTVSLDLSGYTGVIIEFNLSTTRTYTISRVYVKKSDNLIHESTYYFGSGSGLNNANSRGISVVNNEEISFLNSYEGSTVNNTTLIPTKIYGVKEYVVEAVQPVTKDLLWTNPSPTSEFGSTGQINYVDADLTNYEYAVIEYYHNTSDTRTGFFMNKVSDLPLSANGNQIGLGTSYSGNGVCRPVVKNSDNKLGFYGAVDGKGTGLSFCIPVHVYGINGLAF